MKRVITAIIIAAIFIPVLIYSDTIVFPFVISLIGGIAAFEVLYIRGLHKKPYILFPCVIFSMLCPLVSGTDCLKIFVSRSINFLVIAFPAFIMYMFFIAITFNRKVAFSDIAYVCMCVSYVALGMFAVPFIRDRVPVTYLLLIICPCVTDIFALYGGKHFGKKKLCPAVSQHKTVEGSISGVIGSVIAALIYGVIRRYVMDADPNFIRLAFAGVGISVVGQYGDLAASLMKRSSNVKDFGNLFPGHGGIMDRFDSILATFIGAFIFIPVYKDIFNVL